MDQEVAKTLGELELKLRELERELASIGRRAPEPAPPRSPTPRYTQPPAHAQPPSPVQPPPQPHSQPSQLPAQPPVHGQPYPPVHAQSSPLAHEQPPLPAQPQPSAPGPIGLAPTAAEPGRLVDEAVERKGERRYSMDAQETAFGEIPATKDERDTIDLAELVRFKRTLQDTLQGLIDEYGRLLSLRAPADD